MASEFLRVDSVSRSFGGLRALDDVSFSVREAQVAAIIGPNGAGKSTLFNVIAGNVRPDAGRILLKGRPITRTPPHRIAHLGVARTFQTTRLFHHMSVLDNVMVGTHAGTRAGFVACLLSLPWSRREEKQARDRSRGLLTELGLGGREADLAGALSFGQRRLLEIARALAAAPALLLLDEPAAGLNIGETERLGELVQSFPARGITVLLVEHDMSLVMGISQSVVVLAAGRKIAEGRPREVQADRAVIDVYLGPPREEARRAPG